MLVAKNLTKTYNGGQKIALKDFSIEVPEGCIYGLLGPNGAGKTTFIRMLNQIIKPDAGSISINGEALCLKHIREIGYMPEERGLYKNMSVGDQLIYFGELKGMSRKAALDEAKKWFERLNIDQWWKKKITELSKGMAQKIQFVVTVIHRPKLLILDEPFSGFDPVNANLIKDEIIRLKTEGTTIILSTHRMESVEEMCDFVALINNSQKVLDGKLFDVKERFKENRFSVEIFNINREMLAKFKEKYSLNISETVDMSLPLSFEVSGEYEQSAILSDLMTVGDIRRFDEKIPSMNQVFISAVERKNPL